MAQQIPLSADAVAPGAAHANGDGIHEIAPDIAYRRLGIVNVVFVGPPNAGDRGWTLIDAGLPKTRALIAGAAARRFGKGARPAAIVLTHGHFDHVGALEDLARDWDAPVYAHPLEHPYLNGSAAYPPGDPSVGGGLMARLSRLYPTAPVNVGARLRALSDAPIPGLPGWRWIHTPGHSVGHVSFWREADRALIVGDAFVTTAQESLVAVLRQEPELHGPPMYFTDEWDKARESVRTLAALDPELVITGHGPALRGASMGWALKQLAFGFDEVARPAQGVYLTHPARAEDGGAYRRL